MVLWCGRSCKEIVWNDFANWWTENNSTATQSRNSSMPWRPSIYRKKKWDLLESCQKFGSRIVPRLFAIWQRFGRTRHCMDPWTNLHMPSPNGPEHATNVWHVWSRTFITYINSNNIVMRETQHNNAGWDCFRTLAFAGDLEDSKSTSGGPVCKFGSHTFVPTSWMFKKQTSVLAELNGSAEIIPLDAGLRMDGVPALDHWDLVIGAFHSSPNQLKKSKENSTGKLVASHVTQQSHPKPNQDSNPARHSWIEHCWLCFCRTRSLLFSGAMLHVFEVNEAVIKMIIKGRSPTMRHVSRTHRVALDWWFFYWINLDPKIHHQVKHELADMLTKREFQTRSVEQSSLSVWHQPFQLSLLLSEFQLDQLHRNDGEKDARTGRSEQDPGKVKANDEEPGPSLSRQVLQLWRGPIVSKSPRILSKQFCRTDWSSSGNFDARNAKSRPQCRVLKDGKKMLYWNCLQWNLVATEEDPEHLNYPEASVHKGKLVAPGYPGIPGDSGDSETEGNDEYWPHNLHISSNYVNHMEKVSSIVRQRSQSDGSNERPRCEQLFGIFLCLSLFKLQFILVKTTQKFCDLPRINPRNLWTQLFQVTERLITDQTKKYWLTTNDWQHPVWRETTLITDRAVHV